MNESSLHNQSNKVSDMQTEARARLRVAIFIVLGLHAVLLTGLLIVGCKREEATQPAEQPVSTQPVFEPTNVPTIETSAPPVAPVPTAPAATAPVPTAPTPLAQEPTPTTKEYTVESGDTFYSIGKKFGVSYLAIQAANPDVDPRRLKPGQKIIIPAPTTPADTGGHETAAGQPPGQQTIYVVKSGDTLSKIARQFGVTVNAIRRANNLTTDRIKVGDKLKIPTQGAEPGAPAQGSPASTPQRAEPAPAQPSGALQPIPGPAPAT